MPDTKSITVKALRVRQPIGDFFVVAMKAEELVAVSYADVRQMEKNDLDTYIGINRRLALNRVKQLKSYVKTHDATFPTSIILAVKSENARYDEKSATLQLMSKEEGGLGQIAKIIDGQHRIAGLEALGPNDHFELSVAIFVGADIATQANIFATVNLAQTKVNRSLAYDLLDYERKRSPQKSAHHIAVALDQIKHSPFHRRIKRLGLATTGRYGETLTQAVVVEMLLKLTTNDPMADRDTFFKRLRIQKPSLQELKKMPFRGLFLEGNEEDITRILLQYFGAVRSTWPMSWDALEEKGNVLPKTNGFRALMRFLPLAYVHIVEEAFGTVPEQRQFESILAKVELEDKDFNVDNFPPGTSGESRLHGFLKKALAEIQGNM